MGLIHDRGRGGLVARHKATGFSWAAYWATRTPSGLVLTVISDTSIQVDWTDADEAADGIRIYVDDVFARNIPDNKVTVGLFIGADEVSLDIDGDTVKLNGDSLEGIETEITGDIDAIEKVPGVYEVTGSYFKTIEAKAQDKRIYTLFISYDPKKPLVIEMSNIGIYEGVAYENCKQVCQWKVDLTYIMFNFRFSPISEVQHKNGRN